MAVIPDFIRPAAPTSNDSRVQGYFEGKTWLDDSSSSLYRSDDDTPGNAVWTDITPPGSGGGSVHWNDVTGKPTTFTPSGHAHGNPNDIPTLPINKVDALEANLNAKAEAAAVQAQLDGKAALSHSHPQSEITNLVSDLATKQATSQKGQANGYAGLGADGLVPSAQLPASAGPFTVVRKTTADQTNTTVNLANATTLLLPVLANTVYVIEGFLRMRSSLATAGFKLALDVPALAEIIGGTYHPVSAAGAVSGALQRADALNVGATTGVDTVNQDVLVYGYWLLLNGANAGNAQLMFAAEVSATVTMRVGSTLRGMMV